jgi:hypothetical protein
MGYRKAEGWYNNCRNINRQFFLMQYFIKIKKEKRRTNENEKIYYFCYFDIRPDKLCLWHGKPSSS